MDLSKTIGGGKYLKRLSQNQIDNYPAEGSLTTGQWVEVLSLTGKHLVDYVAAAGQTAGNQTKYIVDGVESVVRTVVAQASEVTIVIGLDKYSDAPLYAKESFKVMFRRTSSGYMRINARYSPVAVEPLE